MKRFEHFIYSLLSSKSKKLLVILLTLGAFFGSLLMLSSQMVLAKMLPGKSANTYSVYVDTPEGSSIEQTKKVTSCVVKVLQDEPEVTDIEVFLGQGAPLDYAGLVKGSSYKNAKNVAELVVNLTDKHGRDESSFEMVHRLRPGVKSSCEGLVEGSVIKMIEQPAGPPTLASIVIELYGEDIDGSRRLATQLAGILRDTEGLVDIDTMMDTIYPKYELHVDKEKILRSKLSIEQVNKILYLAFEGRKVAVKNSEDSPEQIPLFLILNEQTREFDALSKEAIERKLSSLKLMNKAGMMVPVSEVVKVHKGSSSPMIYSKNLRRMINVIAETDMVSQVYPLLEARSTIQEKLANEYEIESTKLFNLRLTHKQTGEVYDLVWDGEMKVTLDTFYDLGMAFISALVLIFLLLVVYYKSFAVSGVILLGSFLSLFGVIVGHWIMDIFTVHTFFLTATSLIGFIVLMGISSRNSMLLIDFAKLLMEQKGFEKQRAIAVASATRAKPIFLTAGTVVLASTLLATDPIFGGLGVALIFGTTAGVIVSLIFIPVLLHSVKAMDKPL